MRRAAIALALALATGAACGTEDEQPPVGDTFIAFAPAFAEFRSWPSFHSDGPEPGTQPPDILGPRTHYINKMPPHGSAEFPVGTIVVEAMETEPHHIVAAVKRGGGYNGGRNWEWFEIRESPVVVVWRGLGPPNGESYGGDPNGCNTCHAACGDGNDLRCAAAFQLSGL
jgi:hypothetical protein